MLGTLKLPSPAWGGRRGRKGSREKLLPRFFRGGVGNRLGSVPSLKFPVGTTRRRTHYYHKSQSRLQPVRYAQADAGGGLGAVGSALFLPILDQELTSRVPTGLHGPGRFRSFCFKKQLERYRVSEPLP